MCTQVWNLQQLHIQVRHDWHDADNGLIDEPVFILQNKQTICSQSAAGKYRKDIQIPESEDVLGSHHSI